VADGFLTDLGSEVGGHHAVVDPSVVRLLHKVVVRINVDVGIGDLVLCILEVHADLTLGKAGLLRTVLAVRLEVIGKECELLSIERACFRWVSTSIGECNQGGRCLSPIELDIVVLKDFLAGALVHKAKVDFVSVNLSEATQVAQLVVRRLVQRGLVEWSVSKHDDPWLSYFVVGIDHPVGVSLVVQVADTH